MVKIEVTIKKKLKKCKGTGINNLKDFLTKIAVNDLNFGIQLPEFSITKNAMKSIDNNRF